MILSNELFGNFEMLIDINRKKDGSIIFVVGKSPIDIMEPFLL